jgi:release factor glutamine methyltransferase
MADTPAETPITVGLALARATAALTHLPDPPAEARALLAALTGHPRSRLMAFPEHALGAPEAGRLGAWIARRANGEPLAYLSGRRGFGELELAVTPAVLVPRPETELLVELALAHLPAPDSAPDPGAGPDCLDLGTGSGAIALACARARPDSRWLATDRCPRALGVARRNASTLGIGNVRFVAADWWQGLGGGRFALVASNPPYLAADDPALEGDGLCHEPPTALVGGSDGFRDLARIIDGAPARLAPGGWLLLEHGATQGAAVRAMLQAAGFLAIATHADLAGQPRVSLGRLPGG